MSREPTRNTQGHPSGFDWPDGETDERATSRKGRLDAQMIVAALALVVAFVLLILAF
jgi:hypothetical protein